MTPPPQSHGGRPADAASIAVVLDGDQVRVVLGGEIDAACGEQLRQAGDQVLATGLPVAVHAQRVTFMDCAGAAFLARLAVHRGREQVVVVGAAPPVRFLLTATGLDRVLAWAPPS